MSLGRKMGGALMLIGLVLVAFSFLPSSSGSPTTTSSRTSTTVSSTITTSITTTGPTSVLLTVSAQICSFYTSPPDCSPYTSGAYIKIYQSTNTNYVLAEGMTDSTGTLQLSVKPNTGPVEIDWVAYGQIVGQSSAFIGSSPVSVIVKGDASLLSTTGGLGGQSGVNIVYFGSGLALVFFGAVVYRREE